MQPAVQFVTSKLGLRGIVSPLVWGLAARVSLSVAFSFTKKVATKVLLINASGESALRVGQNFKKQVMFSGKKGFLENERNVCFFLKNVFLSAHACNLKEHTQQQNQH